jgi:c(7)-type cytochrome triheme protein
VGLPGRRAAPALSRGGAGEFLVPRAAAARGVRQPSHQPRFRRGGGEARLVLALDPPPEAHLPGLPLRAPVQLRGEHHGDHRGREPRGKFCGACHDGKELFGHEKPEDCERCHNGDIRRGAERFASLWRLPEERFGNRIDWNKALEDGLLQPANKLSIDPSGEIGFANTILLEAEWPMVPDATFPHGRHTKWLDCNDCHPNIFNIKKKFTAGLRMGSIIELQYCGICHGTVAFPLTDCSRCHPDMKKIPKYPEPVSR